MAYGGGDSIPAFIADKDNAHPCQDLKCTKHTSEKLHCHKCNSFVCRNSSNSAFDPAGTASSTIVGHLSRAVDKALNGEGEEPLFQCHLCDPDEATSLLDQLDAQNLVKIPDKSKVPVGARLRPSRHRQELLSDDEEEEGGTRARRQTEGPDMTQLLAALLQTQQTVQQQLAQQQQQHQQQLAQQQQLLAALLQPQPAPPLNPGGAPPAPNPAVPQAPALGARPPQARSLLGDAVLKNVQLSTFSGEDAASWPSFWSSYNHRVTGAQCSDVDKFEILRGLLTGAALRKLGGLDPCQAGAFAEASRILQENYGDVEDQKAAAFKRLLTLSAPDGVDYASLDNFSDELRLVLGQLKRLQETDATLNTHIHSVWPKVPMEIRQEIHEKRAQAGQPLLPSFAELQTHLDQRLRALRASQLSNTADDPAPYAGASLANAQRQQRRHPPPPASRQPSSSSHPPGSSNRNSRFSCLYCSKEHSPYRCDVVVDPNQRLKIVRDKRRCILCLGSHFQSECGSTKGCRDCDSKAHNTSLHGAQFGQGWKKGKSRAESKKPATTGANSETQSDNTLVSISTQGLLRPTIMATFKATAVNPITGKTIRVSCLIDGGCSFSYLKKSTATHLGLKGIRKLNLESSACHSESRRRVQASVVSLSLVAASGLHQPLQVLATEVIAPPIHVPAAKLPTQLLAQLEHVPHGIANLPPSADEELSLDLLIGGDYSQLFVGPSIPAVPLLPTLTAYLTPFGAILHGSLETGQASKASSLCNVVLATNALLSDSRAQRLENLVRDMSDLEVLGLREGAGAPVSEEMDDVAAMVLSTLKRDDQGRFHVRLPFKAGVEHLPSNFPQAFARAQLTHRRLKPDEKEEYYGEFEKRIKEGVLEVVDGSTPSSTIRHHLPHFPVYKETSLHTRCRPVVDASAPTSLNGASLNSFLHTGSNLLTNLLQVQIKLRVHRFAFCADIKSCFYQIGVQEEDSDALRIVLPKDKEKPLDRGNFRIMRYKRLVMGAGPSPFLLHLVMTKLIQDSIPNASLLNLSKEEMEAILPGQYVDNLIRGYDDANDGRRLVNGLRALFRSACFHLREFAGVDPSAFADVPVEDRVPDRIVKVLGVRWDTHTDHLHLAPTNISASENITRADLLSYVHKPYDPAGWAAPVILAGKLLSQRAFDPNSSWDSLAEEKVCKEWDKLRRDFNRLDEVRVPRRLLPNRRQPCKLILFSDASPHSYGYALYVWSQSSDKTISCQLALAKARLVPSQKKGLLLTIPRLELWAALVGTRATKFFIKSVGDALHVTGVVHFIDSQIVLYWLNNQSNLRKYEARRIDEVIKSELKADFRYIPTHLNPADHCTKPLTLDQLLHSHFLSGPNFLHSDPATWPSWRAPKPDSRLLNGTPPSTRTKGQKAQSLLTVSKRAIPAPAGMDIQRYSRLKTLLGALAYVRRWAGKHSSSRVWDAERGESESGLAPDTGEREEALLLWIRHAQSLHYPDALAALQSNKPKACRLIHQLDLRLDETGIIRLGSRMSNAPISADSKHPMLLPRQHRLVHLLALQVHWDLCHAGASTVLAHLRERFWIPQGQVTIRKALRSCLPCRLSKGKALPPPPHGQLPPDRLEKGVAAWTSLLLDQLGPIHTYDYKTEVSTKRWALLFSDAVSRGLHIEILYDYSANAVLHAMQRFWSRRGITEAVIHLDLATAFQAAAKTVNALLQPSFEHKLYQDLQPFCAYKRLRFHFSPARAAWSQGAVERMVGIVKSSLRPALWRKKVTDEELHTLLVQIESVVNTRPLTGLSTDPRDPTPLTPSHFISPSSHLLPPPAPSHLIPPTGSPSADRLRAMYEKREAILSGFWERWQTEYLTLLRSRHLNERPKSSQHLTPKIGELYLLSDQTPRGCWRTCRIVRLLPDAAGVVRYVDIVTSTGHETRRGVAHLVPLEEMDEEAGVASTPQPGLDGDESTGPEPEGRAAGDGDDGAGPESGPAGDDDGAGHASGDGELPPPGPPHPQLSARAARALRRTRLREGLFQPL